MATAVLVPLEEYLATTYRPDCDYVDGEVRERNVGEWKHGRLQTKLATGLEALERKLGIFVAVELRVQVKPRRFRIPDIVVTIAEPVGDWITEPPFLVVEILSERDSLASIQDRIDDYVEFGVPHIWIVDPVTLRGWDASSGAPKEIRDGVLKTGHPEIAVDLKTLAG
ncbi:MAG: Uma2 family endonuclease [Bryobacteraceae bacterium]|nr:Uma2 family endonuclease [Bryobacteraceae bacterium]